MRKLAASVMALIVGSIGVASPASAVAPHLIMLQGESLSRPVFVTQPYDLFQFMCALEGRATLEAPALEDRPFVSLSAFWGAPWVDYAAKPQWQAEIRADQANHHGRFYPATGSSGAMFVSTAIRVQSVAAPKAVSDFAYAHTLSAECTSVLQQFVGRGRGR